jgi:tetratricopeptide (TPR) repeat protein
MGRMLWELKGFPSNEPFVYTMADKPFVYTSWLFSIIYYAAYHAFNVYGVIILKALTVTVAFFILLRDSLRPYRNYVITVVVMAAVVVLTRHRFVERPDTFLMVFLAFSIFSLNAFICDNKKYIYMLPLTHMLWANSHTSINLMFIPFLSFIVGGYLQRLLAGKGFFFSNAPTAKQLKTIMIIFGASFAASLISPYFIGQYTFGVQVIATDWLKQEITELRPPTWATYKSPYILAAVLFLSFIGNWLKAYFHSRSTSNINQQLPYMPSLIHFMIVIPFMVLSFSAIRFLFLLAIVSGPIIARNISGFIEKTVVQKHAEKGLLSKMITPSLIIVSIILMLFMAQREPFAHMTMSFGFGTNYDLVPERAMRYMDKRKITGRIYNLFQWGQYIVWRDFPKRAPFIDGRAYIEPELFEKIDLARTDIMVLDELYQKYGFEAILINYPAFDRKISNEVFSSEDVAVSHPGWALVYWDDLSLLYLKRGGEYDSVIREDEYRVIKPANLIYDFNIITRKLRNETSRSTIIKELERNTEETGSTIGHSLLGMTLIETGRYREGIDELMKVRTTADINLLPKAYSSIAFGYDRLGDFNESIKYLKKSLAIDEPSAALYYQTGIAYMKTGDKESALKYLKKALDLNRNLSSIYPVLIGLYQELGMQDDVIQTGKMFEEMKVFNESEENFNKGINAYLGGDLKRSIENFKKSIEIIPSNPVSYSNIGYAYFDLGDMDRSFEYQKKAIEIDPNYANAYYGLALIYKKWGDREKAKNYWKEYLRLEPAGYYSRKARKEIDDINK